jgi:hypothetical protein
MMFLMAYEANIFGGFCFSQNMNRIARKELKHVMYAK